VGSPVGVRGLSLW
jgi:CHAT domain-containing protein